MMTDGNPTDHRGEPGEPALDPQDDAALWDLLESAPAPRPVSPYFARRVLREVNLLEEARAAQAAPAHAGPLGWLAGVWQAWQRQPRAALASACAAVALLVAGGAGLTSPYWHARPADRPSLVANVDPAPPSANAAQDDSDPDPSAVVAAAPAPERLTAQDVEVIADLDNLLSREESRLWTEDTARF